MITNFEYQRFEAQSKMREINQRAKTHRELKQSEEPKNSPTSIHWLGKLVLALSYFGQHLPDNMFHF